MRPWERLGWRKGQPETLSADGSLRWGPKSSPFIDGETEVQRKAGQPRVAKKSVGMGTRSWQSWATEEREWECVTSAFDGSIT